MWLLVVLLLSIVQATSPAPNQTANNSAQTSKQAKTESKSDQSTALPSIPAVKINTRNGNGNESQPTTNSNTEQTIGISKLPTVTVSTKRDWADWGYWGFNLLLVGVGVFQVFLLWRTLAAIRRQADLMENSLVAVQRAFVCCKGVEISSRMADGWNLGIRWENSGTTPTKGLEMHVNWASMNKPIPNGYDFTDSRPHVPFVLGPKDTTWCGPLKIPVQDLVGVQQGTHHVYVWGSATYMDVFPGTPKHITKFCWKITGVVGDPATQNAILHYAAHHEHNCADDDCKPAPA
jgi:hypothetical protein